MRILIFILFPFFSFAQCITADCADSTGITDSITLNVSVSVPVKSIRWIHISPGSVTIDNPSISGCWAYNLQLGWNVFQVQAVTATGQLLTANDTVFVNQAVPAPIVQTVVQQVQIPCPVCPVDRTVTSINELPGGIKQILFNRGLPQSF